jgi:addiction module HigA family antidote
MTGMHDPAPPGEVLAGWLEDLDMSVTAFAAHVGISRVMLSRILHGHAAVTADMDLRLHEAWALRPVVAAPASSARPVDGWRACQGTPAGGANRRLTEFCRAYPDGEKTGHLHPAGAAPQMKERREGAR